jgi:hypothetical protein
MHPDEIVAMSAEYHTHAFIAGALGCGSGVAMPAAARKRVRLAGRPRGRALPMTARR